MGKLSLSRMVCLVSMFCVVTAISSPAQTFTTLHSFDKADGANPAAGLVQGTDGNFYGTTGGGGANNNTHCSLSGCGTVFKITPGGTLTTLYSFCAQTNCTDGASPFAGLVQATDGNFYGTTGGGGTGTDNNIITCSDCGTVFKITPSGTLTTLYSFCSQINCTDGTQPHELVQATDGNFYGTTSVGGPLPSMYGTIFKITPSGTLTTLYSFCAQTNCTDGANPSAGLVQATDGNFYGTTAAGGTNSNAGTVFRITPAGTLTTLYNFCARSGCPDGAYPQAGLVQATDGNFYGTTPFGGSTPNGTVFEITPAGRLTTLYNFCSQRNSQGYCIDGAQPTTGLTQGTDGNFYGTTSGGQGQGFPVCGSQSGCGTIFKITPAGQLTTLYTFYFCTDSTCVFGAGPNGLLQATNGNFYGTTVYGGANFHGAVFSLAAGLGPFVKTQPTSGAVGTAVVIVGNNLTGATGVRFNGTAATFTVVSGSEIQTTVPVGATTGIVQVTTPSGTLNSNVPFQVTKTRRRLVQVTSE